MKYQLEATLSPDLEKYRDQIEASIKPYIKITVENNDRLTLWQSKFGGLPYLYKGFEYPKTPDGKYLFFLAQINFAEVPPLENFPKTGILQFYIGGDDERYGVVFYNSKNLDNSYIPAKFKAVYFPEPSLNIENIITNYDFLPKPEYFPFPVTGCCSLHFERKTAPITSENYQFSKILGNEFYELLENHENLCDEYWDISDSSGHKHKIGGYPNFIQGDSRYPDDPRILQDPNILLFQMDSEYNDVVDIVWGDCGIANFFIYESELKKLDFSNVDYRWDCG